VVNRRGQKKAAAKQRRSRRRFRPIGGEEIAAVGN
jgi:hypothetical protein